MAIENIVKGKDEATCGANSFMLRDGVCDELTNTERCLWDGGDCCLDRTKIDRTLCKTCICLATVDSVQLMTLFEALGVMRFDDPGDFPKLISKTEKNVAEVISYQVCTSVCLDTSLDNVVNGWMYNVETRICTCSWVKSTQCFKENALSKMNSLDDFSEDNGFLIMQSFVQTAKVLDCGKDTTFLYER